MCVGSLCVSVSAQISPFYKDPSPTTSGPTPITASSLDDLCKDPVSRKGDMLRYWELGAHIPFFLGGGGGYCLRRHLNVSLLVVPLWGRHHQKCNLEGDTFGFNLRKIFFRFPVAPVCEDLCGHGDCPRNTGAR